MSYQLFKRVGALSLLMAFLMVGLVQAQTPQTTQMKADCTDCGGNMVGGEMGTVADLVERTSGIDGVQFVNANVRAQVNTVAQNLNAQLKQGAFATTSTGEEAVQKGGQDLGEILSAPRQEGAPGAQQSLTRTLVEQGLSEQLAQKLVASVMGLTEGGTVEASRLVEAVTVFNDVVESASASFLRSDSAEFNAIRTVLTSILDAPAR